MCSYLCRPVLSTWRTKRGLVIVAIWQQLRPGFSQLPFWIDRFIFATLCLLLGADCMHVVHVNWSSEGCGPWFRRLFAGQSPRRPGFDLRSVYVRYLMKNRGVPPRTSALPCQRHSAIAPNLSLSVCYFVQLDNRAKRGNLNKGQLFRNRVASRAVCTRVP